MSDELVIRKNLRELYEAAKGVQGTGLPIPWAADRAIELIEDITRCEAKRDATQRARDRECIEAQKKEIERLKLQSEHADCWWNDDSRFDSPDEYADEAGLNVGDEFDLQAAAYWQERYKVTSVRNPETDEGDYECEQISKRREEFPTWFALRERIAELEATLARFQSDKPELGDLSFREQLRSQLIGDSLNEIEALQASNARLRKVLTEVEWAGKCCNVDDDPVCPECGSYKSLGRHAKDCMVAAALAEAKEGE